jgi:MoxR-like ATPase
MAKAIVGQEDVVEQVLTAVFSRGHALLVGVPGLAKTLIVRTLSEVMDLGFRRIQFTPDLMPADVTGSDVLDEDKSTGTHSFRFVKGPVFTNMLLADEINRTPPKTQAALLEAMQEHSVTAGGVSRPLPEPFFVLATQNPIEQDGTYPLPEAQMDRFMFKVSMDFPSVEELGDIVNLTQASMEENATQVIDGPAILKMRDLARDVPCIKEVIDYAMHLVHSTHPEFEDAGEVAKKYIRYGASPRAGQALITGAKIRALIHGNYNVSFEDVDALAFPVLRHRIKINYNAINEGLSIDKTIDLLIKENAKYR